MKKCPFCQTELEDNTNFCPNCGKQTEVFNNDAANSFFSQAPVSNSQANNYNPGPGTPVDQYQTPYNITQPVYTSPVDLGGYGQLSGPERSNAIIDAVGTSLRSPAFLIALIFFSISAIISIIAIFTPIDSSIYSNLNVLYGSALSQRDIIDFLDLLRGSTVIAGLVGFVPTVFGLLAFYMLFASRYDRPVKTVGYAFAKTYVIIKLVISCLVSGAVIVLCIWGGIAIKKLDWGSLSDALSSFGSAYGYYGGGDNTVAELFGEIYAPMILFTVAGVMAIILTFVIIYNIFAIKTVNVMKKAGSEGVLTHKLPSMFVAVIMFILAGFSIFGIAAAFSNALSLISIICSIGLRLSLGIFIVILRNNLKPYATRK